MKRPNERGQIVVEYVLLLAIALSIGIALITALTKVDQEETSNSGSLILKWRGLQETIGQDQQN